MRILIANKMPVEKVKQRGFTLIELLVSLAIISLVFMTALPSLTASLDAYRMRAVLKEITGLTEQLRIQAHLQNQVFLMPDDLISDDLQSASPVSARLQELLTDGWQITGEAVTYLPSGLCLGGELQIISPNGRIGTLTFNPPHC